MKIKSSPYYYSFHSQCKKQQQQHKQTLYLAKLILSTYALYIYIYMCAVLAAYNLIKNKIKVRNVKLNSFYRLILYDHNFSFILFGMSICIMGVLVLCLAYLWIYWKYIWNHSFCCFHFVEKKWSRGFDQVCLWWHAKQLKHLTEEKKTIAWAKQSKWSMNKINFRNCREWCES